MKKIQFKRILGVLILFIIVFAVSFAHVFAEGEEDDEFNEIGPDDASWKECLDTFKKEGYEVLENDESIKFLGFSIARDADNNYVLKMDPKTNDEELLKAFRNMKFKILRINNITDSKENSAIGSEVKYGTDVTFNATLMNPELLRDHAGEPIPDSTTLDALVVVLQSESVISDKVAGVVFKGNASNNKKLKACKSVVRVSVIFSSGGPKVFTGNIEEEGEDDPNKAQKAAIKALLDKLNNSGEKISQEIDCTNVLKACKETDLEKCLFIHGSEDDKATPISTKERMALNFCIIKAKASKAHTYSFAKGQDFSSTTSTKNTTIGGKCSKDKFILPGSDIDSKKSYLFSDNTYTLTADNSYQFLNKDYYFGSGSSVVTLDNSSYKYTYSGSSSPDTVSLSCNLNCDEAIVVEYGPPQAATAGLCIEYQVRVTSIVSCKSTFNGTKPSIGSVCYPGPNCQGNHGDSRIFDQGGPNALFDSCIKSCDGGKYTSKCTKKCYNQVYGTNASLKKSGNSFNSVTATKVDDSTHCTDYNDYWSGYYYRSGSSIGFNGRIANWYRTHVTTRSGYHYTFNHFATSNCWFSNGDGFPRVTAACNIIYAGACDDACWYSGCGNKQYLNNCDALNDYKKNLEIYEAAVSKCEEAATCRTSTTEFNMRVTNGTDTELIFPYTANKSKTKTELKDTDIKYKNDDKTNASQKAFNHESKEVLLRYGGCYYNSAVKNWYHAWWSFPGTWMENKKKEISFVPNKDGSWTFLPNKFCIPYNFKEENQEWYKYYMAKAYNNPIMKEKNSETLSYYDKDGKYCTTEKDFDITTSPAVNKWNIEATAGKDNGFGYFKWKIKVSCFYAFSRTSTIKKDTTTCVEKNENNYRIRTVDLKDMFPHEKGYEVGTTDLFGREPGFNWSKLSTEEKISSYTSFPETYAKKVQTLNTSVYSDSYLDYRFVLNPKDLNAIRNRLKSGSGVSYNSYNGKIVTVDGVNHYVSDLFRSGVGTSPAISSSQIPSALKDGSASNASSPLRCNNMKNYKTSSCYVCDSSECK